MEVEAAEAAAAEAAARRYPAALAALREAQAMDESSDLDMSPTTRLAGKFLQDSSIARSDTPRKQRCSDSFVPLPACAWCATAEAAATAQEERELDEIEAAIGAEQEHEQEPTVVKSKPKPVRSEACSVRRHAA